MKLRALLILLLLLLALPVQAQAPITIGPAVTPAPAAASPTPAAPFNITIGLNGAPAEQGNVSTAIQIVFVMTLLSLAPAIMMLMTSFTRIVIVLGFLRTALGVQSAPSNQIIIGMSIFLTMFIMAPIGDRINAEAIQPYMAKQLTLEEALDKGSAPLRKFMQKQTRPSEIDFFLGISGRGPTKVDQIPMTVVIPAFVVSELRTAFQMGFLIFIPFLVIDFVVASTLMSMGMMMMPPVMISLPFKLLLFVLVDGWHLVVRSLVESFGL
ncbi:MAG: flagellar type III secretion system pore protein FliP [Chthoniobacteraceae bacterium]|nr:flagellar type III secretion system pore protein FliP [Chthoniobacteraceae bacterium]